MSLTSTTFADASFANDIQTRVVKQLANYVSTITGCYTLQLLVATYYNNTITLYVNNYGNNIYHDQLVIELPYDEYTNEELIAIYERNKEYVIDYV